jgi:hypothetical protein
VTQADLLRFAVDVFERLQVAYLVVGSYASGSYGEPRLTLDIDIVIDPPVNQLDAICESFPESDFYVSKEAARSAFQHRSQFNVIHPDSGNKIDLIFPKQDAWSREQLSRRQRVRLLPDKDVFAARPEDVIISKMLFYREGGSEKHLRDMAGMLKVSGADIDQEYVARWAESLGLQDIWRAVVERVKGKSI